MKIGFVKSITTSTNINSDQISSSSLMNIEKRSIYLRKMNYKKIEEKYNKLVVNSLMSNGKCHIVALFKDYLIEDDHSEYLRRFYTKIESNPRLKKLFDYYEETSVIFPNYTPLIEAKYIYKNIMKKQKVIDEQQDLEDKQNYEKTHKIKNEILRKKDYVFNTIVYDEILNQSESILRIIFGINKKTKKCNDNKCNIQFPDDCIVKKENRLDTSNDDDKSSIENIKKIEDIINNISKFDDKINKSKIKLSLTNNIKNKLKLTLTNNNNNNINNNINTNLITISTNNNNISTSYNKTISNNHNQNYSANVHTKTSSKGKKNLKKGLKNPLIKIENNNNYDYKLKNKPTVLRIPIKSLSRTLKYSHTKNNESNLSTNSRNLRNNFTISSKSNRTNTQSLTNRRNYNNNNNYNNHNYNLSMTKINIEPKKISKTKLINFCSIDLNKNFGSNSNNNMLKSLFISNLSSSPNSSNNHNNNNNNNINVNNNNNNKIQKYHTKVRSVIGRNSMNFNNSEFFKTFTNNSKKNCRKSNNLIFENGAVTERKTNQKSKKTFHIKKLEELMNKNKNLIFHNNNGYYTERYIKKKENKKK